MIAKALQVLQASSRPGRLVDRDTVIFQKLMEVLDHPHKHFKGVHVTGTNGKGSTTLKTASILQNSGYKTGLFTSPHIFEFLERIQVNQANCQDQYFAETILRLHEIKQKHKLELTFFQYLTAAAFLYFKDSKCDFAAIQVGLGGRYDTTNVINPEVSVITSIALDHERILGDTREKIAYQKAGIIKPGVPVVVGPNAQLEVVFTEARKNKSKIFLLDDKNFQTFQDQNIAITRKTIQVLQEKGIQISQQAIQKGYNAAQPCHMQVIPKEQLPKWASDKNIILDVAHNPNAIGKIIEHYNKKNRKSPQERICVVFGASKGKNSRDSLLLLQKFADVIYLVSANHNRAQQIDQLKQNIGFLNHPQKYRVVANGQIQKAMTYAVADKQTDTLIVCGSFFVMPEVKSFLKVDEGKFDRQRNLSENYDMKNTSQKGI